MSNLDTAPFYKVDFFDDIPGIKHGFFTRQGGVSDGLYKSLNTGEGSNDNPENVLQNKRIICETLGIKHRSLQTLYQIHSDIVHIVTDTSPLKEGDGMVTDKANIALGIKTADCVPILFACAKTGVIGACHAGWGGAFKGIAQNTVEAMKAIGAKDIHAALGPCLHQESFEVGIEFYKKFVEQSIDNKEFFVIPDGREKYHFDLLSYLRKQLGRSGVNTIKTIELNTYSHEDQFFSYRRSCHKNESDYGRQLSAIVRIE